MARAGRGQAGRRAGGWAQGRSPCCPVRQLADSPAYCRLPAESVRDRARIGCGTPYRGDVPFCYRQAFRFDMGVGAAWHKERPRGPTNRAAAAAGRRGRRTRRWGAPPAVLPAHPGAQGWTAGGAWPLPGCLRMPAWPAAAGGRGAGRPPLHEERTAAAVLALPPGKGRAAARAVSSDVEPDVKPGVQSHRPVGKVASWGILARFKTAISPEIAVNALLRLFGGKGLNHQQSGRRPRCRRK